MSFSITKENWILKYKLYHIPFWMLYHYVWWVIYDGSAKQAFLNMFYPPFNIKFLFYVIFQALGVYFCLYYLIPKYLERGRYLMFLGYLAIVIIVVALFICGGYYLSAVVADESVYKLYKLPEGKFYILFKSQSFPSTISAMTLAMSIKLAKNWMEGQKRQQLLEKEKLETELKFLKSQFNPHFLFNSINSIFFLIDRNPEMATASLAKFSDLLRYQLYECNEAQIPLQRELSYLENFIELEKLRQNENVEVNVNLPEYDTENLEIAPFVLMPFIENAFKHISKSNQQQNEIEISIELQDKRLNCVISNTFSASEITQDVMQYGGLGLQNVKRRLELMYPGKYQLDIEEKEHFYIVCLNIELSAIRSNQLTLNANT